MNRPILTALLTLLLALCAAAPSLASAQTPDQVLATFDDEPSIIDTQRAALSFAGLDPELINSWYTRANTAKLMPKRAQYRLQLRDIDQNYNRFTEDLNAQSLGLGSETQRQIRSDSRLEHQVLVQWDLSEAVFNPDVLRVSREVGRQVKQREDILAAVTKLYFERRRAQVDVVLTPPTDPGDRLRKQLAIQELTAQIDALTGGWFGQKLVSIGKDPY
jgi:hypothetical protein